MEEHPLLRPDFTHAHWRVCCRLRFRDLPEFSRRKGHFSPEEYSSSANRFAEELTRADSAAEMHRIAENAASLLGLRRSKMVRAERQLETSVFRCATAASQDSEDPSRILVVRRVWMLAPLDSLPPAFDEIFPWKVNELVVPFEAGVGRAEILERLEDWAELLEGRLEESLDQSRLKLSLSEGLCVEVDLTAKEASFSKSRVEGVLAISGAVSRALRDLPVRKRLFDS